MKPHISMYRGLWIVSWHGIEYMACGNFRKIATQLKAIGKNHWGILQ